MIASVGILLYAHNGHAAPAPTVEIAPSVFMPMINLGISNHTLWLDAGGRGLDTALVYGDAAQEEVGHVVRRSSIPRHDLFVTTKVPCCPATTWERFCNASGSCARLGNDTESQIQHDLDTLGLDYVDLMLLHWPCDTLEESLNTYRAMERMVEAGTARAIGVSNFNASWLEQLYKQAKIKPSINQCALSIGDHTAALWGRDDATVAMCKQLGVHFEAYSPLGGWARGGTGAILNNPTVKSIAVKHNKSSAQVALRWLVQQDIIVVTASNEIAYDEADLDIFDFSLTSDEMSTLANIG